MPDIAKLLGDYFSTKQQIHGAFGYKADWCEIPLDDLTDVYWWFGLGEIYWCNAQPSQETVDSNDGEYSAEIYTQRFLPRWVYSIETHTLISIDTHCDGNKFLAVFDNSKYVGLEPLVEIVARMPTNSIFDKE